MLMGQIGELLEHQLAFHPIGRMKRGSSQRCDGALTVRGADEIPGDTAPTGEDRQRVRSRLGRARLGVSEPDWT